MRKAKWQNPLVLQHIYEEIDKRHEISFNGLLHATRYVVAKDSTLKKILGILVASGVVAKRVAEEYEVGKIDVRWLNLKKRPVFYSSTGGKPTVEMGVKAYIAHGVAFEYDESLPYFSVMEETDWIGLARSSIFKNSRGTTFIAASVEDLLVRALQKWFDEEGKIFRQLTVMLYSEHSVDKEYLEDRSDKYNVGELLQRFLSSFKEAFWTVTAEGLRTNPFFLEVRNTILHRHPELKHVKGEPLIPYNEVIEQASKEIVYL